jgi:type IV pilus assembly protein PilW
MINGLKQSKGFSLIETMVGLVIGLIATLVIMQVYATFEGQKRTTTGSADAQTNGALALYAIQRDVGNAGFGLPVVDGNANALNCPVGTTIDPDAGGPIPPLDIFPVQITDGGAAAGNSDQIALRFGGGAFNIGVGSVKVSSGSFPTITNAVTAGVVVYSNGAADNLFCRNNDIGLAMVDVRTQPSVGTLTACGSVRITSATATGFSLNTLVTDPTKAGNSVAGVVSVACLGAIPAVTVPATPGPWNENKYSVVGNQLVMEQNLSGVTTPVAANIVNIQAQYGVSATGASGTITEWVNATTTNADGVDWVTPTLANRNRIKAVRIAVVARNSQLEKLPVTNGCNSTVSVSTGVALTGLCAWAGTTASPAPTIDVSDDANWQRYRYRVFSTIIPIRTAIWSGGA